MIEMEKCLTILRNYNKTSCKYSFLHYGREKIMEFLVLSVIYLLLIFCAYFLGKIWFPLLCGLVTLGVVIYFNVYGQYDTKFYCNKADDKCVYMKNSLYNKTFKEYKSFRISDIKDVEYEENVRTRYSRRLGKRQYLARDIIFLMYDNSRNFYPSVLISSNSEENKSIVWRIKRFLNSYREEYSDSTDKDGTPSYGWWIFSFLLGCSLGIGLYYVLLEDSGLRERK